MKKLVKPMVIAAAVAMAFSATAFAGETYQLKINGKAAEEEVLVLVPLRETAEKLGFTVSYDKGTILVDDGTMHANLTVGKNSYQVVTSNPDLVGMSAPFSLSAAPVVTDGKTYVPIELFVPLMGNDSNSIQVDGTTISLDKIEHITDNTEKKSEAVEIPNPLTEHKTLAELEKTVGFAVTLPTVDQAYAATAFIDIAGETADVRFTSGADEIMFRKAKGTEDISGDYNTYKETKTVTVKDVAVTVKGNDGIHVATWQKDGFTYALSSTQTLTEDALIAMIDGLL